MPITACALSKERKLYIQEDMCKWLEVKSMERERWREIVLHDLFSSHITPILNSLKMTSRISLDILWENIAIRINSMYYRTLKEERDSDKIDKMNSDFTFLKNTSGELFHLKENPIKQYPIKQYLKLGEDFKTNPYRKTCCMFYKLKENTEGILYCKACPIGNKKNKMSKG